MALTLTATLTYLYLMQLVLAAAQKLPLYPEQALVHSRAGNHAAALSLLALLPPRLVEGSTAYCRALGSKEAWLELLDMFLNPRESPAAAAAVEAAASAAAPGSSSSLLNLEPDYVSACRVLNAEGASLNPLRLLAALPGDMPLHLAGDMLGQMVVGLQHRHRYGQVVRNLHRCRQLAVQAELVELQSQRVLLTDDTACNGCNRFIGNKVFYRIELQGTGFDDTIQIYIGPYKCDVDVASITGSTIVCFTTAAADFGAFNLTVSSSGSSDVFSLCCFTYSKELSPSLMLIDPAAGPPDSSPALIGEITGALYWYWSNSEGSGRTDYIGKIRFGDHHCYFSDQAGGDVFLPDVADYNAQLQLLRQQATYRLHCDLPNPHNTWTIQSGANSGLGVAGNLNVSLHFQKDFGQGRAVIKPPAYVASRDGVPHMFQMHAEIHSITPQTGSTAGGTLLTITGIGFPTSADLTKGQASLEISIAEATGPCRVTESSYVTIKCITLPQASTGGVAISNSSSSASGEDEAAAPGVGLVFPGSVVPGPRGWVYELFMNNWTSKGNAVSLVQSEIPAWSVTNATHNGTRYIFTDHFEGKNITSSYFGSRGTAFFIPPASGSYSFTLIGDDVYRLRALYHNGTNWQLQTLVGASSPVSNWCQGYEWNCHTRWGASPTLFSSQPLALQAGQPVLLSVTHWNGASLGSWQVGLRVPSTVPGFFSIRDVQRVTLPYVARPHSQLVKVLFRQAAEAGTEVTISLAAGAAGAGVGGTSAGSNPAVSGLNAGDSSDTIPFNLNYKLTNPRVGINLTINTIPIPTFPVNITATALQQLLSGSLKAQMAVEKIISMEADVDGSTKNLTVYDEVWENVTVGLDVSDFNATSIASGNASKDSNNSIVFSSSSNVLAGGAADAPPLSVGLDEAASPSALQDSFLTGLSVSVVNMEPPPDGGAANGVWQLLLEGQDESATAAIDLYWNASLSQLKAAAQKLQGGVDAACAPGAEASSCIYSEGGLRGRAYIIRWAVQSQNNVRHYTARPKGGMMPSYNVISADVFSTASPPLAGGIQVGLGPYCDSVLLDVTDTAYGIAAKLNTLPGVNSIDVRVDGNVYNTITWTLTFNPYINPGKQPLLRVVDSSMLTGASGPVQVVQVVNGSTDYFYGPLPGELLRQPVDAVTANTVGAEVFPAKLPAPPTTSTSPSSGTATSTSTAAASALTGSLVPGRLKQVQVLANTVLSSCKSPDATACAFSYSAAATPSVNAVSPESLTAGGVLTIEGSGFAAAEKMANRVLVSVQGKGDAINIPSSTISSNNTSGTANNGSHLFMVNITASPSAALLLQDVSPSNLSTQGITLIQLSVINLPSYVLSDHTGEAGGTSMLLSSSISSSAGSSDSNSPACSTWLTVAVAGSVCPVIGCSGHTSAAVITALFPGHLVNETAITFDQHNKVDVVLTVVNAAGSYTVTRRKLAALRHPPILRIPSALGGTSASKLDSNLSASDQEALDFWEAPLPLITELRRFTFYLRVPYGGNISFWITVDDAVQVTMTDLEGHMLLKRTFSGGSPQRAYSMDRIPDAGSQLLVVLSYVEHAKKATLTLTWDALAPGNSSAAQSMIRPQSVALLPSGAPLPLVVQVNGIAATCNCSGSAGQAQAAALQASAATSAAAPGVRGYGELAGDITQGWLPCKTFSLSSLLGLAVAGTLKPSVINASRTMLVLPVMVPAGVAPADLVVNVGGKSCVGPIQLLEMDDADTSAAASSGAATPAPPSHTLQCIAPELPAGIYTFQVLHKRWGAAALQPWVADTTITYAPSITSVGPASNISSYGGVTLNITGFGFAPMEGQLSSLSQSEFATQVNGTASDGSAGLGIVNITSNPGSPTKPALHHYAVAATLLPTAAPGVVGVPLIPWDMTQPESAQHLAPHDPPTPATAAAAGLAVPEISVQIVSTQSRDVLARCMVLEATTAWVSCQLQRSKARFITGQNILQVAIRGLDNTTRTATATAGHLPFIWPSTWTITQMSILGAANTSSSSLKLRPYSPSTSINITFTATTGLVWQALRNAAVAAPAGTTGGAELMPPSTTAASNTSSGGVNGTLFLSAPAVGASSLVSGVYIVCERRVYPCASPVVLKAAANFSEQSPRYQESLRCDLPASGLPAALQCQAILQLPGLGFGQPTNPAQVDVALEMVSMHPTAGSLAGGQLLTLRGKGKQRFDIYNSWVVRVNVGPVPCRVTSVSPTEVTCITGPSPAGLSAGSNSSYTINITASDGSTFPVAALGDYTYTPDLTPVVTNIVPNRGSTEGGTLVVLSVSNMEPTPWSVAATPAGGRRLMMSRGILQQVTGLVNTSAAPLSGSAAAGATPGSIGISVTIAGAACTNVVRLDPTSIRCETGKAPGALGSRPLGPQAVTVTVQGKGAAISNSSSGSPVTYEYVDLWSRRTTWGGDAPPVENDSVVIPAGTTVMLDVSPPRLYMLLIEGTLLIDPTAPSLSLDANYILLRGGALRAGLSQAQYHPGNFTITLWGDKYNTRRLPNFGAKVLASLDGQIQLYGAPVAVPSWTTLNSTADIGNSSITVNGQLNWQPGFTVVIASSSFDARDVDMAIITAVQPLPGGTTTRLLLSSPLQYTHLGVVRRYPGDPRQHVLDMRAEVAVLNRNIVIQGDPSTADSMFGGHVLSTWSKRPGLPRPTMQLSNVELRQMGQAYQMGRYPIHFHMIGDASYQSWVANCSIHHTWNRGVTIHGTHQVRVTHNVAFATTGHTFFLEDGIETGNVFIGNLGMLTQVSNGMLITDNNPATFWITHPNNTYIGNVAAGSLEGFGFWYHLQDYPDGPSKTYDICPKYEALGVFRNNVAHSNQFYGLRIHPEYYPRTDPCGWSRGQGWRLIPAVFEGLIGYKNGVNCLVATQVGTIQYHNMTCADSGAGVKMLPVNGKDSGSHYEIIFEVDTRSRVSNPLTSMAGLFNALAVAQTQEGLRGSLIPWPSDRWIAAVTAPQTLLGAYQHHAHMAIVNFTIVGFAGYSHSGNEFRALESCAHCKDDTGGNTALTRGLTFLPPSSALDISVPPAPLPAGYESYYDPSVVQPRLFHWSWAHQGIFVDTDGSLINPVTMKAPAGAFLGAGWSLTDCRSVLGAASDYDIRSKAIPLGGCSAHSSAGNNLFRPEECFSLSPANGMVCRPGITYRRVMLNNHAPQALAFRDLIVRDVETNRSSVCHQSKYNEMGYVFTAAVGRTYWVHWAIPYRVDPVRFTLHKMDVLNDDSWLFIQTKQLQAAAAWAVNGQQQEAITSLPDPLNATTGTLFYSRVPSVNTLWSWNGTRYNDTTASVLLAGGSDATLTIEPLSCAGGAESCDMLGVSLSVDLRNRTLYWSDPATWPGGVKPATGEDVNIPNGWELVINESPPALGRVLIEGNVTISSRRDVTFTAGYIVVRNNGSLTAGSPTSPHNRKLDILLTGNRSSTNVIITSKLNIGAKVLAAVDGGSIGLWGQPVGARWSRLAASAEQGSSSLLVAGTNLGWAVGGKITVTSSSYNWQQAETRSIVALMERPSINSLAAAGFGDGSIYDSLTAASPALGTAGPAPDNTKQEQYNVTLVTLDQPLDARHSAAVLSWDGLVVDLRPEVAYLTSNIIIRAADGSWQKDGEGGEKFGVRVMASGPSLLQLDNVALSHCGQAGLGRLAALKPRGKAAAMANASAAAARMPAAVDVAAARGLGLSLNPSFLNGSSVINVMDLAAWISSADNPYMGVEAAATNGSYAAAVVSGNVLGGSLDVDTVRVDVRGSVVVDNLGWGTVKDMSGKSKFDNLLPATFRVPVNDVVLRRNAAAGSERIGFYLAGEPCSSLPGSKTAAAAAAALRVANNSAHSSLVGLMLEANDEGEGCSGAVGFSVWRNWDFGVFTVKGILTSVTLLDLVAADTKHVGALILYQGALADPVEVNMNRVGFIGMSGTDACSICNGSTARARDRTCHQKLSRQSYNQDVPYTPAVGLASSTFTLLASPGPEFKPWDTVKGYPTILGATTVHAAVFGGYAGPGACEGSHPGAYAIGNHPLDPDAFHPMTFSSVKLPGSSRSQGLLLSTHPDPSWMNEGDCADKAWNLTSNQKQDMFSTKVYDINNPPPDLLPINCAGPRHVLLRDSDGSLSGSGKPGSTILGGFTKERRIQPNGIDQGSMVLPGPCQYQPDWGAYLCVPGVWDSGLDSGWAPEPLPSKGLLADPQLFVLESRDDDRETRVFDPVIFSLPGSGQMDLVTNAMDQGCCFGYGFCQKRLNAFWTVLPTEHLVAVNFTGSPGRFWRVWLPYAEATSSLLLQLNFGDVPDRRYLWTAGRGRLAPVAAPPTLTDNSPGGSYYWDQVAMTFTLKIAGGQMFEIRTESVLYVTPRLAMSVDDFYAQKATFIANLASVLGIDKSRIRVARVVPGSAVVSIEIGEAPAVSAAPMPEKPFNMTYNMDVSTGLNVLQQVRSGALPQDVSQSNYFTTVDPLSPSPIPDGTGGTISSPAAPAAPPPPITTANDSSTSLPSTDPTSSQVSDPGAPPTALPAPTPSPAPVADSISSICTGAAAAACELGSVYLTLTQALANGSAQQSLGVTIQNITADLKVASPSLLQAVQAALPLPIDLASGGSKDLTAFAQQGRETLAASGGPPPAAAQPDTTAGAQGSRDMTSVTVGVAIAGVMLGVAAAVGYTIRQRRQRMRIAFTDLGAVARTTQACRDQVSQDHPARRASTDAGASAATGAFLSQAAGSTGGSGQHSGVATGTTRPAAGRTDTFIEAIRGQPFLPAARSLRSLFSGGYSWGRVKSGPGDGSDLGTVLPGAVLPGSRSPACVGGSSGGSQASGASGGSAAVSGGSTVDDGVVVGSPNVQTSVARKESLRHRSGVSRQPADSAEPAVAAAASLAAATMWEGSGGVGGGAGAVPSVDIGQPAGTSDSKKLPPLASRWRMSDKPPGGH
eukprot:gene7195-7409_t